MQIVSSDVNIYNFAMAHLRTTGGVEQVVPVSINPGGVSYVNVTYRGDLSGLRAGARRPRLECRAERLRAAHVVEWQARRRRMAPPPQPQPQPAPPAQAPQSPAAERR